MTDLSPEHARSPGFDDSTLRDQNRRDARRVALLAAGVMLLTLLPYLISASQAGDRAYMWLGYNLDDSCVYLSWMRQAASGHTHVFNLFTTDPQRGMAINPLFLALGTLARLTGLPLLAVYHGARLVFGFALLLLVWQFLRQTIADRRARWLGLFFVCFSSGLGWLPFWWEAAPLATPIDKWQPEAITFLSLYLSPLFCFSLALQVGILSLLLQSERQATLAGRLKYAIAAGGCGFLLGLSHTYDILSLGAVWGLYLIVNTFRPLPVPSDAFRASTSIRWHSWLGAGVCGLLTLPAVLYIYGQLRSETVFRARANVLTLSPAPAWVILGYGLTFALALTGIYLLAQRTGAIQNSARVNAEIDIINAGPEEQPSESAAGNAASFSSNLPSAQALNTPSAPRLQTNWTTDLRAARLLVVWMVANLAIAYVPGLPFQRKMLQGAHFPIAILAAVGAVWLLGVSRFRVRASRFPYAAIPLVVLLGLTNLRFVLRDLDNAAINRAQTLLERPYLQPGEIEALRWVAAHTQPDDAIQPLPWVAFAGARQIGTSDISLACFTPGLIERKVYCGHWGETPDFQSKLQELARIGLPTFPDEQRRALLRRMQTRYLVFSQKASNDNDADTLMPMFRDRVALPSYLVKVYGNADADVYAVNLPPLSSF